VQVGGPLGSYVPPDQLDLPVDYEAFAAAGAMVGHGGIVVFDDAVDMAGWPGSRWSSALASRAASARRA
jgi:formate dehydrogenase iron-sulfur subunit